MADPSGEVTMSWSSALELTPVPVTVTESGFQASGRKTLSNPAAASSAMSARAEAQTPLVKRRISRGVRRLAFGIRRIGYRLVIIVAIPVVLGYATERRTPNAERRS